MPKWKTLGKDEWDIKENDKTDVRYERVTEIISAKDCEKTAYQSKKGTKGQVHRGTVAGTIVHWMIEKYLAEKYDLTPPPPLELALSPKELELWEREKNKVDMRVEDRIVKTQTMRPRIDNAYYNFLKFINTPTSIWNLYEMEPIYLERQVHSDEHKITGTIDCICIATIDGIRQIVVVDWKSGSYAGDGHAWQLAAYAMVLDEMIEKGKINLPDLPISPKAFCVRLGGEYKDYEVSTYNTKRKSFLEQFFLAKKIYDTVTDNARGWCGRCMFCSYRGICES